MAQEYPPPLTSAQTEYLLSSIKDWSILNGLAIRPSHTFVPRDMDPSGSLAVTAPVTLFPSLFPRACFEEARAIQVAYNELYAAIAGDEEWLRGIVEDLVKVDDFISKLWDVHLAVKKESYVQDLSLGLFRSDYMVHQDPEDPTTTPEIKQVEFNTIASSFGGLASKVSSLHSYLLSANAYPPANPPIITPTSLPPNPSIASLSLGLATAHNAYGTSKSSPELPLCILFIVQLLENNVFDQLALSLHLNTHHHISTYYLPFPSVLAHTSIPSHLPTRPLIYTPPHSPSTPYEVSLLYFRAGYTPADYQLPSSWPARLHLERSAAIKCPSILTHLAGSKKVQQILATPSSPHLERFLPRNSAFLPRIRQTFAAIYPLDDTPAGQHATKLATDPVSALSHVLKPQREGGGNNIYGAKIPPFLASLGSDQRQWRAYILMELIQPPPRRNSLFRNGTCLTGDVIGELGIFGACLWRHGSSSSSSSDGGATRTADENGKHHVPRGAVVLENWEAGWLLRTKGRASEEGGVAAGFGAVDSLCLI